MRKSSTSLSWRRGSLLGPVQKTIEILQLQYIDKVVDVLGVHVVQVPQVQVVRIRGGHSAFSVVMAAMRFLRPL